MELIKITETKRWVTSGGHKTSSRFALFKCPHCSKEVEKSLHSGKRARSCGDTECRKATFVANPHNIGNTKTHTRADIPYIRALTERHRNLNKDYEVCDKWKTLDGFLEDMQDGYEEARKTGTKIFLKVYGTIASPETCRWEPVGKFAKYPNSSDPTKKYVYLITTGNYCKIGITNNITNRFTSLQTGCPYPMDLVTAIEVRDAYKIEQNLHSKYIKLRHYGEWFNLSEAQIKEITAYLDTLS